MIPVGVLAGQGAGRKITVIGSALTADSNSATSVTSGALDTTPEVDDLYLVFGKVAANGRTLTPSATGLTFTSVYTGDYAYGGTGIWYARLPSASGPAVTLTMTGAVGRMTMTVIALRGVNATPVDAAVTFGYHDGSTTTYNMPGPTTVHDWARAFIFVYGGDDNDMSCTQAGWITHSARNIATGACTAAVSLEVATGGTNVGNVSFSEASRGPDPADALILAMRAEIA